MIPTHRMRKRVAALAAAAAVLGSVAISTGIADAAAGDPSAGAVTFAPSSGSSNSNFALGIPSGAFCPGDSTAGWQWSAFVVPSGTDIGALRFSTSGLVQTPSGGTAALHRSLQNGGVNIVSQNPNLVDGLINPSSLSSVSLSGAALTPGVYSVAVACYNLQAASPSFLLAGKFFTAPITVAAATGAGLNNFIWGQPAVPATPTIGAATISPPAPAVPTTATVPFTVPPSIDNLNAFTATVIETTGAGVVLAPTNPAVAYGGVQASPTTAGSFAFSVSLGSSYAVSLTATNDVGTSAPATRSVGPITVTAPGPIPITVLDPFERAGFNIGWIAPAAGPAPTDYTVEILTAPTTGAPAVVSTFNNVIGTTLAVAAAPALPAPPTYVVGNYTARVTANYPAGSGVTATAGNQAFSVRPNTLIIQKITVTRPAGALILTQRCGVFGPLAAFGGVDSFPGFPVRPLTPGPWTGILVAASASTDQVGTSPDINPTLPGVQADPEFVANNYPEPVPATYPTECGLSMGSARFVTSGALAGQFYTATGRLNQVTVLDNRDTDTGWIARGDIADTFVGTTGNTFSGDYLGWVPAVTKTSDPIVGSAGYDQIVTPGAPVLPGSNVTVANQATQTGLTENPILAEAPLNQGLGIAEMNARMNLLIPASIDAADYSANLSLTVVPRP